MNPRKSGCRGEIKIDRGGGGEVEILLVEISTDQKLRPSNSNSAWPPIAVKLCKPTLSLRRGLERVRRRRGVDGQQTLRVHLGTGNPRWHVYNEKEGG